MHTFITLYVKSPINIFPRNSGFKVVYAASWWLSSKIEEDVDAVFLKVYDRLKNIDRAAMKHGINGLEITNFELTIHIYNATTGEYIKLPTVRVFIKP